MIYIATLLLFSLAVLTIYAIIQSGKNNVLTFFLIPLVLISSLYTGYSIYALQGTPIDSLPKGEVEVLWAEVQKPNIYFLVRHVDDPKPAFYRMDYTKENAKKMQDLSEKADAGQPSNGEFKLKDKDGGISQMKEFTFDTIRRESLPPKVKSLQMQGVDDGIINKIAR